MLCFQYLTSVRRLLLGNSYYASGTSIKPRTLILLTQNEIREYLQILPHSLSSRYDTGGYDTRKQTRPARTGPELRVLAGGPGSLRPPASQRGTACPARLPG